MVGKAANQEEKSFKLNLKVSSSLSGGISCSLSSADASGSLLVDALKTSVTLITFSNNAGHNAVSKQVCSTEVTDL